MLTEMHTLSHIFKPNVTDVMHHRFSFFVISELFSHQHLVSVIAPGMIRHFLNQIQNK
jgi:hypothetical protein